MLSCFACLLRLIARSFFQFGQIVGHLVSSFYFSELFRDFAFLVSSTATTACSSRNAVALESFADFGVFEQSELLRAVFLAPLAWPLCEGEYIGALF